VVSLFLSVFYFFISLINRNLLTLCLSMS